MAWRFLIAIEMTSIAVHAASAESTVSTGLPPWFERRSSKAMACPELGLRHEQHPAAMFEADRLVGGHRRFSQDAAGVASSAGRSDRNCSRYSRA